MQLPRPRGGRRADRGRHLAGGFGIGRPGPVTGDGRPAGERDVALFDDSQIELRRRLFAVWELVDDGSLDAATEDAVRDALARIGKPGHA